MNKKVSLTKWLSIGILLLIVIGILFSVGIFNHKSGNVSKGVPLPPDIDRLSSRNAYDMGLMRAKEWRPDAVLAKIISSPGKTGVSGRSDDWELLFVSKSLKRKALRVVITNKMIAAALEIPYVAPGGDLPENIISSQEAIARVHAIPGYENEPVISVELLYGPDGSAWYWGVKTAKGVITIKAGK